MRRSSSTKPRAARPFVTPRWLITKHAREKKKAMAIRREKKARAEQPLRLGQNDLHHLLFLYTQQHYRLSWADVRQFVSGQMLAGDIVRMQCVSRHPPGAFSLVITDYGLALIAKLKLLGRVPPSMKLPL